jgi:hypothetical protein
VAWTGTAGGAGSRQTGRNATLGMAPAKAAVKTHGKPTATQPRDNDQRTGNARQAVANRGLERAAKRTTGSKSNTQEQA